MLVRPRFLLQAEGLALLAGALALYYHGGFNWLLLLVLFLAPDLSFAAYSAGPRTGAAGYNLLHNMVLPVALGAIGLLAESDPAEAVALIWLAHIEVDRLLGYGLKYATAMRDTHLQRI